MRHNTSSPLPIVEIIESQLMQLYGPLLTGDDLAKALGYRSRDALRQAVKRRTFPVPLFEIQNRRGKFASTHDVAVFLATVLPNEAGDC